MKDDDVIEIGGIIYFHRQSNEAIDYICRIGLSQGNSLTFSGDVNINGNLAVQGSAGRCGKISLFPLNTIPENIIIFQSSGQF